MQKLVRIGTRESQLALWQAGLVKDLLIKNGIESKLVTIKSEGDIDLKTPLYEIGVQGIFTRALDIALLDNTIDLAVHSLKDIPTQLARGIALAAVLKRDNPKDLLVYNGDWRLPSVSSGSNGEEQSPHALIATSSIRRKAQWLHRFPGDTIENLRGNVNTRLAKLKDSKWNGAIFAAAGLERIGIRPDNAVELDWMLPAPAQGSIAVVCRESDQDRLSACQPLHDENSWQCAKAERDFLRTLLGGCSTPIAALAEIEEGEIYFRGNLLSPDGKHKVEIEKILPLEIAGDLGKSAAEELLMQGGDKIIALLTHVEK
ncbi:MAG: hydroxymethylbilane synthase [Bacteroidetes bacterium]|nr:MAG: hydroxymethylbilane synthase [Bacteroidota bacterium]